MHKSSSQTASWKIVPLRATGKSNERRSPTKYSTSCSRAAAVRSSSRERAKPSRSSSFSRDARRRPSRNLRPSNAPLRSSRRRRDLPGSRSRLGRPSSSPFFSCLRLSLYAYRTRQDRKKFHLRTRKVAEADIKRVSAPFCRFPLHRLRRLPGHHRTAHLAGPEAGIYGCLRRAEAPTVFGLYPPGVVAGCVAEDPRGRRGKVRRAGQLPYCHALPFEQPDFLLGAECIPSCGAVVPDHPVAGDDERDGVVCHDRTHGAGGFRGAGLASHPGVGSDLAARNPLYYLQHLPLKGRLPREVRRDLDLLASERRGDPLGELVR